jgi:hypothetical protein
MLASFLRMDVVENIYGVLALHSSDWKALGENRFAPATAELLTGVSTSLQRKWFQLHFSSLPEENWQWEVSVGGQRRFTWGGIQMLAFFRDVTKDLGTGVAVDSKVHVSAGEQATDIPALYGSHLFEVDHRCRKEGDLYLCRSLKKDAPDHFTIASTNGVHKLLTTEWASRLYLYNVSAMQRELAELYRRLDQSLSAPTANLVRRS